MLKPILTIFILCKVFLVQGQQPFQKNDLYFEAGGLGLFGSLNYERQLTKKPGLGVRIGVGFYTENAFYLTIPVGIHYLFKLRKENSFLDAGFGVTPTRVDAKLFTGSKGSNGEHFVNFIPSLGYRRHTPGGMMWRIGFTPVINKYGLIPSIGAALGKRF